MNIKIAITEDREILGAGYDEADLVKKIHMKFMMENPGNTITTKKENSGYDYYVHYFNGEGVMAFIVEEVEIL